MAITELPGKLGTDFDEAFDVIVVGFGFAGGAAAIEASDRGCSVLLVEKMPDPGASPLPPAAVSEPRAMLRRPSPI